MKTLNRKNRCFISCMPDFFLAIIFVVVASIIVYYAYSEEQEKVLAKQNMIKKINKDKFEIKK